MLARYVLADLVRNPRRTLSTMAGVVLGVGLFCGVLFFVDGLSASMTQRAVAPLPIDMQRIVTERVGGALELTQAYDGPATAGSGSTTVVRLELRNTSDVAANEVTVRSLPGAEVSFVRGSARVDGTRPRGFDDNPFAHGPGEIGLNLGTVQPGAVRRISYEVVATADTALDSAVASSYSSRESVSPVAANQASVVPLAELAREIARVDGVARASQLSFADLGAGTVTASGSTIRGQAKILGFDTTYASHDDTVRIVSGELSRDGAVLSVEAAAELDVGRGDRVTLTLPDDSELDLTVTGTADLSRARSLFSSRRGGDLETFIYTSSSVVVSPGLFAERVLPAYERAASARGTRLKSPPVREIDIALDRELLAADPSTALTQTQRIASAVNAVATHQDYLLDNISNTLTVAAADAGVAKRLFVFLGVPGGLLAAMLAAYAGSVLAEGQRREQATLRIRGASRQHLLRMLALRLALLTAAGALVGLALGYGAAWTVLGGQSLSRASSSSLVTSAVLGTMGGFLATGAALYVTGRRSIDREINEDRAQLTRRTPLWRRAGLDLAGLAVLVVGTAWAVRAHAFDGAPGSVYFGRAVQLNLSLLVLPVAVWVAGALVAARVIGGVLRRTQPRSSPTPGRALLSLYRFSVGRRPWSIANGTIVVALIVALAVSLSAFTASYDGAKTRDARFANGSDLRITPGPQSAQGADASDPDRFRTAGINQVTPVIYAASNVILRSDRTSDPANLAAIDPVTYPAVAPVGDDQFPAGDAAGALTLLRRDPRAILVSQEMAAFLKADVGDTLHVLLARATPAQVEVPVRITGLFERLPGFPDGVDAVLGIAKHAREVPTKAPDFFLASARTNDDAGLRAAAASVREGPGSAEHLQIDTRLTSLATDQSSLAALNISGLVALDGTFALSMAAVAVAIFVFGLLLQRRREYITLRAQGMSSRSVRLLITAEAGTVAVGGAATGTLVGAAMGAYFVKVLRPLFVLDPTYVLTVTGVAVPVALVLVATLVSSVAASRLVNSLDPTELLRDE